MKHLEETETSPVAYNTALIMASERLNVSFFVEHDLALILKKSFWEIHTFNGMGWRQVVSVQS